MSDDARIDIIYTFQGNSRSEKIIDELGRLRQKLGLLERTAFVVLASREAPLFQKVRAGHLEAVWLVDADLPGKKHLRFVPGRSRSTDGLPDWASAKYVVRVGRSCNNVGRSAQQIFAIFVSKYQDHLARYPLPWGPAEDPEAKKHRAEKEKNRKSRNRERRRRSDSLFA